MDISNNIYKEYNVRKESVFMLFEKIKSENNGVINDLRIIDVVYKYLNNPKDPKGFNPVDLKITNEFTSALEKIKFNGLSGSKFGTNFKTFDEYIKERFEKDFKDFKQMFDIIKSKFHFVILYKFNSKMDFIECLEMYILKKKDGDELHQTAAGMINLDNTDITDGAKTQEIIQLRQYLAINIANTISAHVSNEKNNGMVLQNSDQIDGFLSDNKYKEYNVGKFIEKLNESIVKNESYLIAHIA